MLDQRTRTLIASAQVGNTDIRIGLLSADLPDTVAVYPILPGEPGLLAPG